MQNRTINTGVLKRACISGCKQEQHSQVHDQPEELREEGENSSWKAIARVKELVYNYAPNIAQ